jgi:hypothetical protein
MKKIILLALLASCTVKTPQEFDVSAQVHRKSIDTNKGIIIQVFPIDKDEAMK